MSEAFASEPLAPAAPRLTVVPGLMVSAPVAKLVPLRAKVPAPLSIRAGVFVFAMAPLRVSVFVSAVMVAEPDPMVIGPGKVMAPEPMTAKFPFTVMGLAVVWTTEPSIAPPAMVSVLATAPSALMVVSESVPALRVTPPPVKPALALPSTNEPVPFLMIPPPVSAIAPLSARELVLIPRPGELTVMVLAVLPAATAPLKVSGALPRWVRFALSVMALLALTPVPLVLSRVALLETVNVPAPRPAAALRLMVPAL